MSQGSEHEPLELITAIVRRGKANEIAHAAVEAGAHAVTIHHARGIGAGEHLHFFGVAIHSEKEMLFTVVPESLAEKVYDTIVEKGRLHEHGTGFIFMQAVKRASGKVSHTLETD
jgi:nitrogen regulatory protein PII